ncbi:MAG: hypothetical protein F6K11_32730, partial [Leptolyngbya sp. SIO3F4]|nr:hypothetical protein [Leptolyngbya sp. SIO3F4]
MKRKRGFRRWIQRLLDWWASLFGQRKKRPRPIGFKADERDSVASTQTVSKPGLESQEQTNVQQESQGDRNVVSGSVGRDLNITYQNSDIHKKFFKYLCQAPQKPDYYVERPEALAQVKRYLLQPDESCNTFVIAAICGLGGIGKSVLAAALCYEEDIRQRFSDGILWVTLGQEPDILPALSEWIQALGDYDYKPASANAAKIHLRTLLQEKCMLLVVDDVWDPAHGEFFRVGGASCCELVTTREAVIRDAKRCEMNVMTPEQAMELLTNAMDRQLADDEQEQAGKLAKAVGYLPLALQLAAAQLEQDLATWEELLEDLTAEMARLENFDLPGTQFAGSQASKQQNISLIASFNLSLESLQREQLSRFIRLGILPEDVVVTEGVAAMLWGVPPRKARGLLNFFYNRALLLAGAKQRDGKPGYRMHDIVRYLGKRLIQSPVEPTTPGDLPGLGLTLAGVHSELLDAYKAQTSNGQWHGLADDGYIYGHLTWHLIQAGRVDEIHSLMSETDKDGRNGWYKACERLGRTANFVTDLGRAWEQAERLLEERPTESMVLQWRYGVIRATLNNLAGNIPPTLIARLLTAGRWQPSQALAYVQQLPEFVKRADALVEIVPSLPESLKDEALTIANQIPSEPWKAYALCGIAQHIPSLVNDVFALLEQIQSEYSRSYALSGLAPHLPSERFDQALAITEQIQDESSRSYALSGLAPHLPSERFDQALAITEQIRDEPKRAEIIFSLVDQVQQSSDIALTVISSIRSSAWRAYTLCNNIKYLPDRQQQSIELVEQIQDESSRSSALSGLAPHLPSERFDQALAITEQIQDESWRSS